MPPSGREGDRLRWKEPALREVLTSFMSTIFRSPFHYKWKGERWSFRKRYYFWGFICVWIFLSHFSCFFFRKRRNKRNQTEREKRRKAVLAVRKSDSTGFAGLWWWHSTLTVYSQKPRRSADVFARLVWGIQHPFQRGLGEFAGLWRFGTP